MKHYYEKYKISSLSSLTDNKLQPLLDAYKISVHVEEVMLDNIPLIGTKPQKFKWQENKIENAHNSEYITHMRKSFIGRNFSKTHQILDVYDDKNYLSIRLVYGTSDIVVHTKTNAVDERINLELIIELKTVS